MLTGVEILLERMKTNPEEFIEGGMSKWTRVLDAGWAIMTEDERDALQAGLNEAKRDHFNGEVMKVLAQGHDDLVTMDSHMEERIYKGKRLMQGNNGPSAVVSKKSMIAQTAQILSDEFDKAYAERTGSSPYQQRK
jgi:hypothetical protein